MSGLLAAIFPAALFIGGLGLFIGLGLGYAGKKFYIKEDEEVSLILGLLPGTNCGVCGHSGCEQLARAVAEGSAPVAACPIADSLKIAAALGKAAPDSEKHTAHVKCGGNASKAEVLYEYEGIKDCGAAVILSGGGFMACGDGCLGFGSCAAVCPVDAIYVIDKIAVIDDVECTACGACIDKCPRKLIELIPQKSCRIKCASHADAKTVRKNCKAGCFSCKLCEKACPFGAVRISNNLPRIDRDKCRLCGICAEKCPAGVIYCRKNTDTT